MPNPSDELIRRSAYAREGFAERYDEFRPAPPAALLELLARRARCERPALVVSRLRDRTVDPGVGAALRACRRC